MARAEEKNLALPAANQACRARIDKLEPATAPVWGKMTPAQMMAHCSEVLEVAGGKELKGTPLFIKLIKPMIRKAVLGPNPFPRSTRTHPQYLMAGDMDFAAEKERLLRGLDDFTKKCAGRIEGFHHPVFGTLTVDEAGWAMYKHLDHHLAQFGV